MFLNILAIGTSSKKKASRLIGDISFFLIKKDLPYKLMCAQKENFTKKLDPCNQI
jgi:hypothetical protein